MFVNSPILYVWWVDSHVRCLNFNYYYTPSNCFKTRSPGVVATSTCLSDIFLSRIIPIVVEKVSCLPVTVKLLAPTYTHISYSWSYIPLKLHCGYLFIIIIIVVPKEDRTVGKETCSKYMQISSITSWKHLETLFFLLGGWPQAKFWNQCCPYDNYMLVPLYV